MLHLLGLVPDYLLTLISLAVGGIFSLALGYLSGVRKGRIREQEDRRREQDYGN